MFIKKLSFSLEKKQQEENVLQQYSAEKCGFVPTITKK